MLVPYVDTFLLVAYSLVKYIKRKQASKRPNATHRETEMKYINLQRQNNAD